MNCDGARALANASVDGELDLVREIEIEAHLKDCAACARLYDAQREWRTALLSHDLYSRAPVDLHRRVRQALTASGAGSPRSLGRAWHLWPALAAAAALILLAVSAAWMLRARPASDELVAREAVAAHVRSLLPGHLMDVPSSDQHTVKPWFAGRVDFSPPVTDFSGRGFELVGGRLDYLDGRTVAVVVYKRRQHILNLFMSPSRDQAPVRMGSSRGYNLVHWSRAGLEYWLVSDLNSTELRQFADLLQTGT